MGHELMEIGADARGVAIAGPTASGKSALALDLAERIGGTIINADSMQVYADLRILTARPTEDDERRVPHALYGHLGGADAYSAARWAEDARAAVRVAWEAGRVPILVGGTGLYFRSLFHGLAPVPEVPPDVRAHWRERAAREPAPVLHAVLARRDPTMAARLRPSDSQRIVRALEVIEGTGRSLADWQADPTPPLVDPGGWTRVVVRRARADLRHRAAARAEAMLETGGIAEVADLLSRNYSPDAPVMRAIGVPEISRYLRRIISREDASRELQLSTWRYVKRQDTWFRGQMADWSWHSLE